ncbi:hypothetical protein H8N00_26325 [Streptomyces sp. AC563]|uniref:hypothetical protein n=1 Tax=Streptomyces buecherae TaxID=2763006 RepID=UPI00164D11EF|nr:hypothetical protein [Streptomyces buecherae]MBC3992331.1 hypothetical protein [Streptomyces buecherae]
MTNVVQQPPPHDWIPPGGGVRWTRIGELGWHALTVPTYLGDRVLAALGDASGAVIEEDVERRQTWLIEPNSPTMQRFHGHPVVSVRGDDDSFLFVPGMTRDHTVWWRVAPTGDRLLTDAELLATAVVDARGRGRVS